MNFNIKNKLSGNKIILGILIFGFLLRLGFLMWGAEIFYGRTDFYANSDTYAWFDAFNNLLEHGTFTTAPGDKYGFFGRIPGFSFYLGLFYLLCGKNLETAFIVISWVQLILDTFAIYLIFRICCKIFISKEVSFICAALYSAYPFIIVWNPVSYSESIGVFFMIVSVYFFLHDRNKYNYAYCGLFVSLGILNSFPHPHYAVFCPSLRQ